MRPIAALLALATVLALSACSPPVAGMLGLTVRDDRLILLVQSCDVAIVDIRITADDARVSFLSSERVLPGPCRRVSPRSTSAMRRSSPRGSTPRWCTRSAGPAIRVDDLAIPDGTVLYPRDGHPLEHATGSVEEFVDAACRPPFSAPLG